MGQLISSLVIRLTGGLSKTDVNLEYDTYGFEGDVDYSTDRNEEYQPSDYDEIYDDVMDGTRVRGITPPNRPRRTPQKVKTSVLKNQLILLVLASCQQAEGGLLLCVCLPLSSGHYCFRDNRHPFPHQTRFL